LELYDLSPGRPTREAEYLGESVLGGSGLGEHTTRLRATPTRGIDHHGLLDAGAREGDGPV
ncbi:hypothetical protein, partial [Frankia sp. Cr1]|uniref:hypothetical protein n=1 Tax=Frankia sp. Cr1 TaxID=3073931 RepID=UPI002AD5125C